jgi:hypothetical protein
MAGDGQTLQWRSIDTEGRTVFVDQEPYDSAQQRAVDGFKSLFVSEDLL